MKRALSLASEVPMYLKNFWPARWADRGKRRVCCENPIRPMSGESFSNPQLERFLCFLL